MLLNHLIDPALTPAYFGFFEDFLREDGIADGGAFDFTAIAVGTLATNAANGGWARISGVATTDDSGGQIQAKGAHVATDGKFIGCKTRMQLNESTSTNGATESEWYVGLFPVDTSIVASFPADGVYFAKADGGTAIQCIVRVGGVNVFSTTITATADKSTHHYGIGIVPSTANGATVEFSLDGVRVARADGLALPASSVVLTPSIAFQSGDATGTKFLDVDYVGSIQAR